MMMIVSKHTIEYDEIKYRKQDESLLTGRETFTTTNIILQPNNLDGCYIVYNILRSTFIMSGIRRLEYVRGGRNTARLA